MVDIEYLFEFLFIRTDIGYIYWLILNLYLFNFVCLFVCLFVVVVVFCQYRYWISLLILNINLSFLFISYRYWLYIG